MFPVLFGAAPQQKPARVIDFFTDTNGTALTAHVMDKGLGWTNASGTFQIQSNQATPNAGGFDVATTDASAADCTVEVDYTDNGTSHDNDAGIFFRSDGTYLGYVFWQNSAAGWQLTEVTAGPTYNSRGSFAQALNPGQKYHLKVVLLGQSITCYVDGVLAVSYSGALYQANTKHGIHSFMGAGYSTSFDNFQVR
jgi:hypothetical protein